MFSKPTRRLLLLCALLPSLGFRGTGSATFLEGKTESLIFFISDADTEWTAAEKTEMIQMIYGAENWLISQAADNGRILDFSHHFYGWESDITVPAIQDGIRSGYEDVTLAKKITTILGYESPQQLLEQYPADNTQLLFVLKKDGASYAFAYDIGMSEDYYVEGMAIYHRFAPDMPNCEACIAHEMLHLFGAHDYYKTFQTTSEQEELARTQFPDSIMLRTSYNINELNIDPISKWRLGWFDEKPAQADFFTPVSYPPKAVEILEGGLGTDGFDKIIDPSIKLEGILGTQDLEGLFAEPIEENDEENNEEQKNKK